MHPGAGCPCGSGRHPDRCCSRRSGSTPSSPRAADGGATSYQVTTAAGERDADETDPGSPPPVAAPREAEAEGGYLRLRQALQDPAGGVAAALSRLRDPTDPKLPPALIQVLFHGHEEELLQWLPLILGPPGTVDFEIEVAGRSLRDVAGDLVLERHARLAGPPDVPTLRRALSAVGSPSIPELLRLFEARRRLPPEALRRDRYRYDRPGARLVPLLEALTVRFAHLLSAHWGWPAGRALLARSQLDALLLSRLDPRFDLEGLHACRHCALEAPARPDLGRGATALGLDVSAIIITWPQRLGDGGGPFTASALIEALPIWVRFLEALGLLDRLPARRLGRATDQLGRMLAGSLAAEAAGLRDRALAAAAHRLSQGQPEAS